MYIISYFLITIIYFFICAENVLITIIHHYYYINRMKFCECFTKKKKRKRNFASDYCKDVSISWKFQQQQQQHILEVSFGSKDLSLMFRGRFQTFITKLHQILKSTLYASKECVNILNFRTNKSIRN